MSGKKPGISELEPMIDQHRETQETPNTRPDGRDFETFICSVHTYIHTGGARKDLHLIGGALFMLLRTAVLELEE